MKVIKYKWLAGTVNIGTEEEPVMEDVLYDVERSYNEFNMEIARKEAYNGEYTIEDNGKPEPETPSGDDSTVWDELDAAYQAGYDEGYTEGVNSAYDQ